MRRLTLLIFCTLSCIGAAAAWILWSPNTPYDSSARPLYVLPNASFTNVVDSLKNGNLIKYPWTFTAVAHVTGWKDQMKAGHYIFSSGQSNIDLLQTLRRGLQTPVSVRIPAGSTHDRIARSAAKNLLFGPDDFASALRDTALAASLNTDTLHLFSYMLPDTYYFYWLTKASDVVRRIKKESDAFFEHELAGEAERRNLTQDQVVSLAAIVEWETSLNAEKPRIAGVYLNRLRKDWPMQADPTVQYALLDLEGKKRRLFYRDYRTPHPYNTYLYQGLPPGPVTNPSASSLRATAMAESHDYMFFVASPSGGHNFNVTLQNHNRDASALRRHMANRRRQKVKKVR